MNNYNSQNEFDSILDTLQEHFTSVVESDGFTWNEISSVLMLKIRRNWTVESSNSNYQINSNDVSSFFPILQISESFPHWRMSMDGKVPTAVLTEFEEQVTTEADWLDGIISYRHKIQNSYPYLQLTLEDTLRTLKNALRENNQIYFLKKHKEDKYYVLATRTELFEDDKFLAINPNLSLSDNTQFHLSEISSSDIRGTENFQSNIIYYGPPGTGKTRKIQYNHLAGKDDRNSKFITFHQSYSYEEFIEGLKPLLVHGHISIYDNSNLREFIKYTFITLLEDLGWEEVCQNLQETDSSINSNPYKGLRLAEYFGSNNLLGKFAEEQTSDSLSSSGTQRYFEVPVHTRTGEYIYLTTQWADITGTGLTYQNFKSFVQRVSGGRYLSTQKDGNYILNKQSDLESNVIYKIVKGIFYDACEAASRLAGYSSLQDCISDTPDERVEKMNQAVSSNNIFVLCIDEINRANISSVFGDLITLIESKKRLGDVEEMSAILPYSKEKFGVPRNLQIIGTMNTADRSITLLDSALRRRFYFEEVLPRPEVLQGVEIDGINVSMLLEKLNKRITYFLGKDQSIGHSYFIGLEKSTTPKKDLLSIFWNNIIPLLEEYFYNDIPKIRLVLGENNKTDNLAFYKLDEEADIEQLFGNIEEDIDVDEETPTFEKNPVLIELATLGEESQIDKDIFIKVYE